MQIISRSHTFDSGHRVMNERMKCFNVHGHTYLVDVKFNFNSMLDIGYAIDFKEIKRVALQWIDDYLDHGMILNAKDVHVIDSCSKVGSKIWLMSLAGKDAEGNLKYCNPTVELVAQEIFLAMEILFESYKALSVYEIALNETPKCMTQCFSSSIDPNARINFREHRGEQLRKYAEQKGIVEYDDRKI